MYNRCFAGIFNYDLVRYHYLGIILQNQDRCIFFYSLQNFQPHNIGHYSQQLIKVYNWEFTIQSLYKMHITHTFAIPLKHATHVLTDWSAGPQQLFVSRYFNR
jgi:hypothetical protein